MDGEAWQAAVHGVSKSWTRLSGFTFTFHFHASEKGMATHSSVLAWRIPGTGEPCRLLSMGSHRVGHDWSDLAAAAAAVEFTWTGAPMLPRRFPPTQRSWKFLERKERAGKKQAVPWENSFFLFLKTWGWSSYSVAVAMAGGQRCLDAVSFPSFPPCSPLPPSHFFLSSAFTSSFPNIYQAPTGPHALCWAFGYCWTFLLSFYVHGFKQPRIENIQRKNSRKFQKAKFEFAIQRQLFTCIPIALTIMSNLGII